MQLSSQQITEYQKIYRLRFGVDISHEEAYQQGIALLNMLKLIYKPIATEDLKNLQECRRKENLDEAQNKKTIEQAD